MNRTTRLMLIGLAAAWLWCGAEIVVAQPGGEAGGEPGGEPGGQPGERPGDRPPRERLRDRADGERPAWREKIEERRRERAERLRREVEDGERQRVELTDAQIENALAVIKDNRPEVYARLNNAMQENPERARIFISHIYSKSHEMRELINLRQGDRQHYDDRVADNKLTLRNAQLAQQIRTARAEGSGSDVSALTERLREGLEQQFAVRQRLRERKIAMIEKHLDKLREELGDHADRKADLIEQAMKDYLEGRGQGDPPRERVGDGGTERDRAPDRPRPFRPDRGAAPDDATDDGATIRPQTIRPRTDRETE